MVCRVNQRRGGSQTASLPVITMQRSQRPWVTRVIPGDRCTRKVGFCLIHFGKGQKPEKVWEFGRMWRQLVCCRLCLCGNLASLELEKRAVHQSKHPCSSLQFYNITVRFFPSAIANSFFCGISNKSKTKNFIAMVTFSSHQLSQCVNNSLIKMKARSVCLEPAPYVLVSTHWARVNCKGVIAENYFLKTQFLCLQWLFGGKEILSQKGNGTNSFTCAMVFLGGEIGCKDKKAVEKVAAPLRVCGNLAADEKSLKAIPSLVS